MKRRNTAREWDSSYSRICSQILLGICKTNNTKNGMDRRFKKYSLYPVACKVIILCLPILLASVFFLGFFYPGTYKISGISENQGFWQIER